jgi:hypothetical protein
VQNRARSRPLISRTHDVLEKAVFSLPSAPPRLVDCVQGETVGIIVALPSGEPVHVPTVSFRHRPASVAFCFPYLLSVGSPDSSDLEVHATVDARDEVVQVCHSSRASFAAISDSILTRFMILCRLCG